MMKIEGFREHNTDLKNAILVGEFSLKLGEVAREVSTFNGNLEDEMNKIKGKISFVETQGREDLYDVNFNDHVTIRSIQPSENRAELHSEVNWGIMTEGILLFDKDGKRL